MTKHLILVKIQNMMDVKGFLLQCFIDFLTKNASLADKSPFVVTIKNEIKSNKELAKD